MGCLAALLALIVTPFAYIVNGWALSILWDWFVTSVFDVPSLNVPIAIGLSIVIGYLTASTPDLDKKTESKSEGEFVQSVCTSVMYSFLRPLIILGVGWIVLQFV